MKKHGFELRKSTPVFAMALFVLMLLCIMMLCIFATSIYASIVETKENSGDKRSALSYVTQRVRSADEKGAIQIERGAFGDTLILKEISADTGCETRIYLYEGEILEEYAFSDSELSPQDAQKIAKAERFDLINESGMLIVATSEGAAYISLHTKETQ